MQLWIATSLFLVSELHLLILFSLQGSDGEIISVLEVHQLSTRFHDILENAVSKRVVMQLMFLHILILFSDSVVNTGIHSSPFLKILRTLLLLMRFAFMATLNGLWLRHSNNLPLACGSPQPLLQVAKSELQLGSNFILKSFLFWIFMVGHCQRSITWKLE